MKDLDKLYREVPQIESPATLDDKVLRASRSRQALPHTQSRWSWRIAGHAISYLCIFGIGLGVLLQTGFFSAATRHNQTSSDVAISPKVAAEDAFMQPLESATVDQPLPAVEALQVPQSRSAPLRVDGSESVDIPLQKESSLLSAAPVDKRRQQLTTDRAEAASAKSQAALTAADAGAVIQRDSQTQYSATDDAVGNSMVNSLDHKLPQKKQEKTHEKSTQDNQLTTRSTEWLMNQSPDLYTLRIASGESAERLRVFASRLSLKTDLVQIKHDATRWLLLHGVFATRHQGEQAMSELTQRSLLQDIPGDVQAIPEVVLYEALQRQGG